MSEQEPIDAVIHRGVAPGSCVMIEDNEIVYAGPLEGVPEGSGKVMLLSNHDFARLNLDFSGSGHH
jgi:hypothetical protein